jgi:folate-binding protein YgfZ
LTNAKGKMQSDLNVYCLADELLLDFEPGFTAAVTERLEKYIIADDVQINDLAPHYGLLSVQGPNAGSVIAGAGLDLELPAQRLSFRKRNDPALGEIYCMNQPRGLSLGFDIFIPALKLGEAADKFIASAKAVGGRPCGWQALEIVRIEAGVPRFGTDMDETNLAPETGIESRAISYTKGCYIGQEVIARIRTYGQVAKSLRPLRLAPDLKELPRKDDKLFHGDKAAGYITSAVASPAFKSNIALGYVRREFNQLGTELILHSAAGESMAKVVEFPLV